MCLVNLEPLLSASIVAPTRSDRMVAMPARWELVVRAQTKPPGCAGGDGRDQQSPPERRPGARGKARSRRRLRGLRRSPLQRNAHGLPELRLERLCTRSNIVVYAEQVGAGSGGGGWGLDSRPPTMRL